MQNLPEGIYYYGDPTKALPEGELRIGVHIWYKDIEVKNPEYAIELEEMLLTNDVPILIFEENQRL